MSRHQSKGLSACLAQLAGCFSVTPSIQRACKHRFRNSFDCHNPFTTREVEIMRASKHFPFFVATIIALIAISGCGGGGHLSFPTPQGMFTNANLNGPYAFSYTGSDAGGFLAVAGSFQADG